VTAGGAVIRPWAASRDNEFSRIGCAAQRSARSMPETRLPTPSVRQTPPSAIGDPNRWKASADPPSLPSPTIAQCLNGGYGWLEVQCKRCETRASIPLDAIRRPRHEPIWKLETAFRCRSCGTPRYRPPVIMIRLTKEQNITPYAWTHPDDDERRCTFRSLGPLTNAANDEVVRGASEAAASQLGDLKKPAMAEAAERLLADKGCLPTLLRMPQWRPRSTASRQRQAGPPSGPAFCLGIIARPMPVRSHLQWATDFVFSELAVRTCPTCTPNCPRQMFHITLARGPRNLSVIQLQDYRVELISSLCRS
jgi:hypothetical protein